MKICSLSVLLMALSGPVFAHSGHGAADGLWHGLLHPVLGPDHLLAMLAVGLWSGFVLPNRVWLGAGCFLGAMVLGAALSWSGVDIPMVEGWIALSVAAFGLLTLFSRRGQPKGITIGSLAAIALFAMCHGHAHATEASGDALAYLAGFLFSTAGLHLAGIALARAVAARPRVQQAMGAGVALSGVWLIAG